MFKINSNNKLKIWTLITHALIVVGFGHGILTLGIIEILWFPYITKHPFSFDLSASFEAYLPVIGLITLAGQILLVASAFQKKLYSRIIFQLLVLAFLWLSIFYYLHGVSEEHNIHFAGVTAIPFAICTLITFFGYSVKRFYDWVIDM